MAYLFDARTEEGKQKAREDCGYLEAERMMENEEFRLVTVKGMTFCSTCWRELREAAINKAKAELEKRWGGKSQ